MNGLGILLIRADANTIIGVGHIMRCLALAQVWKEKGGAVVLALAASNKALESRFEAEGLELEVLSVEAGSEADALATVDLARKRQVCWTVLDGYYFDENYQKVIFASTFRVLILSDYLHATRFYGTILLNQNLHASFDEYTRAAPGLKLLLGNRFTLLRREFWAWRGKRQKHSGAVRRVMVTLGGGDTDNVTAKILKGLEELVDFGFEVIAVVGANNPHWKMLESLQQKAAISIRLERNLSDMTPLMSACDLAICGGGATCWEMIFFGIPILTVILAANQQPIAESLDAAGVALNLGWHDQLESAEVAAGVRKLAGDASCLQRMSQQGQALIDGRGVERVFNEMIVFQ
ncbi:MAG: UDP-2,4-diacetamido-2,4,6-trideoxy-beta-L-altropyranose hydrolase [bacterium]